MGFLDQSVCHWRVPGEVALALSYPILWYRMYSVGLPGISTETQLLHFLTFFFRYMCYPSELFGISYYNSAGKLWYTTCSILTLAFLLIRQRSSLNLKPTRLLLSTTFLLLILSAIICVIPINVGVSSRLDYVGNDTFVHTFEGITFFHGTSLSFLKGEAPWSMSQFVSVGAMIPQLVMLFKGAGGAGPSIALLNDDEANRKPVRVAAGVDVLMWTYVVSVAAFRTFYIPHWIWRWNTQGFIDPPAQFCAVLQLLIIYGFIIAIVIKSSRSKKQAHQHLSPESGFATDFGKGPSSYSPPVRGSDEKKQVIPIIVVTDVA